MNAQQFDKLARDVMKRAEACYLSTISHDGHPFVRAMVNLRNSRLYPDQAQWISANLPSMMLIYSTLSRSAKVRQLAANPKASVLYAMPDEFKGITFVGQMEVSTDPKLQAGIFHPDWRIYYPDGPHDAGHTVLTMQPVLAECWLDTEKFTFALEKP